MHHTIIVTHHLNRFSANQVFYAFKINIQLMSPANTAFFIYCNNL